MFSFLGYRILHCESILLAGENKEVFFQTKVLMQEFNFKNIITKCTLPDGRPDW